MRKKLAFVALLFCAGTTARSPAAEDDIRVGLRPAREAGGLPAHSPMLGPAQRSLRYTVELEGLRELTQRLELRAPGWRLLALERGAGSAPGFPDLGLECPWAAAGPLAPRGLLRALSDPLGYSPASGVFSEPAGFRLEGGMQGASRSGLWLEPLPGRLGLFLVRRRPEGAEDPRSWLLGEGSRGLVQAGGCATFRWPGLDRPAGRASPESASHAGRAKVWPPGFAPALRAEAQALAVFSHPEADGRVASPASGASASCPQEWQRERPPFPGGGLLHLGGALRLEAGEGRLGCCLLAAASGGQRVPAGLLGLWRLEAEGRLWSLRALLGTCSRDYRLPQGEPYPGAWAAGLRLEAQPCPQLRLQAGWQRRIDWPPAVPEGQLPGTEQAQLGARLAVPLRGGGRLEARAAAEAGARYAADGGVEASAATDLGLQLSGLPGSLALELRGNWEDGAAGLRGQLGGERGGVRIQVGAAGQLSPGSAAPAGRWRPFGRLELTGEGFRFWFSAGGGDSGRDVSLGWSAAQGLPKSPTVRISRCRR
jgi:hypothetical protein